MKDEITNYTNKIRNCMTQLQDNSDNIVKTLNIIENSDKVYICGNGGSAVNASHISMHFTNMICLTDNIATVTAISNDYTYEYIFSRQLQELATKNDSLIVMSGSGNSPNILHAISMGKFLGMRIIAIIGYDGGEIKQTYEDEIDVIINVNAEMQHSEDVQLIIGHLLWTLKNLEK